MFCWFEALKMSAFTRFSGLKILVSVQDLTFCYSENWGPEGLKTWIFWLAPPRRRMTSLNWKTRCKAVQLKEMTRFVTWDRIGLEHYKTAIERITSDMRGVLGEEGLPGIGGRKVWGSAPKPQKLLKGLHSQLVLLVFLTCFAQVFRRTCILLLSLLLLQKESLSFSQLFSQSLSNLFRKLGKWFQHTPHLLFPLLLHPQFPAK